MKINLDITKYKKYFEKNKNSFFYFVAIIFFLLVGVGVFVILTVKPDKSIVSKGVQKSTDADISFDKIFLNELKNKKSPVIIDGDGGRNPFQPY